jgi:hypothetical protein
MGWWPFRGGSSGGDVRAQRLPGDSAAKAAAQQAAQDKQLDELLKQAPAQESDILAASLPKPTSIFEFGEGVPIGGDVLRGEEGRGDALRGEAWLCVSSSVAPTITTAARLQRLRPLDPPLSCSPLPPSLRAAH